MRLDESLPPSPRSASVVLLRALGSRLAWALLPLGLIAVLLPACGDDDGPTRPDPGVTLHEVDGAWSCDTSVSCQDLYDLQLVAGTEVHLAVSRVTGSSAVRLAVFAPTTDLDGTNLLTETTTDRLCAGQDEADSVSFTARLDGRYRVAVGRDWDTSSGSDGSYHLTLRSDLPFTFVEQSADDVASQAADAACMVSSLTEMGTWSCDTGVSCMDVWEVEGQAGTTLTLRVQGLTGSSVLRWALFEPGETYSGVNLLTGTDLDRMCKGPDEGDEFTLVLPADGVYRVAVGRDAQASTGGAGSYDLVMEADRLIHSQGQVEDNLPVLSSGTVCYDEPLQSFAVPGRWECELGQSCEDLYDLDFAQAGAEVRIGVEEVSGNSVVRLALYGPGVVSGGLNLLTGDTMDRLCAAQNESDSVSVVLDEAGTYRLAVGRDDAESTGQDGSYRLVVESAGVDFVVSRVENDAVEASTETPTCSSREVVLPGTWTCASLVSCQDVYRFGLAAGTPVDLSVLDVTGSSVVRLAVFGPGDGVGGTNLLTGDGTDLLCGAQDEDLDAAFTATTTGIYRVAVGRDWDQSAGSDGNYALQVTAPSYFLSLGAETQDEASQASGVSCP